MSNPWCTLMEKGHGQFRGWSFDPTRDLWVCGECGKPSRAVYFRVDYSSVDSAPVSDPSDRIMA